LLLIFIISSCSTKTGITITSNPEKAKIYVNDLSSNEKKLIGETPYSGTSKDLLAATKGSGPVFITLERDGHFSQRLFITELNASDLNLNLTLSPERVVEEAQFLDEIISGLFESQRLVKSNRIEDALRLLAKLEERAPYLSTIYEIRGGIFFIQKNYAGALESFNLALKYNPKNVEARRLKSALIEMNNNQKPSN
jgi:tetratricopeptide (TPR) repeat protein